MYICVRPSNRLIEIEKDFPDFPFPEGKLEIRQVDGKRELVLVTEEDVQLKNACISVNEMYETLRTMHECEIVEVDPDGIGATFYVAGIGTLKL